MSDQHGRYCEGCGAGTEPDARFCENCGKPLGTSSDAPTVSQAAVGPEPETGQTAAVFPPIAPGQPYAYPVTYGEPQQGQGHSAGLIVGVAGASLVAMAAIATVVILVASGGRHGSSPTVSLATVAAAPISAAPEPPSAASEGVNTPDGGGLSQGGSAGTSSVSTPSLTPSPAPSSSSQGATASASSASVSSVIEQHWALISSGDFSGAFALLEPGTQDRGQWISSHQQTAPISATISLGTPTFNSSDSATVPIVSLHTQDSTGCNDWTGSYDMTKAGDQWTIAKANLNQHSC